jgi:hypothetical protein
VLLPVECISSMKISAEDQDFRNKSLIIFDLLLCNVFEF